jgi:hypothetical protein
MESDSEECDDVCEGDNTNMCGGKEKSSIFSMHMCQSTEEDLKLRQAAALGMKANMEAKLAYARSVAAVLQESGEVIQAQMGPVGDSAASDLGQAEKVFAGQLNETTKVAADIASELGSLSNTPVLKDFLDAATVTLAERVMEAIDDMLEQGEEFMSELQRFTSLAEPKAQAFAAKQYYPVMYFVNKKFTDVPSTCTGDIVAQPMVASKDACATACDAHIHSCVGYQHFGWDNSESGTCHLFSNFKTASYYTGCDQKRPSFLETSQGKTCSRFESGCFAKFSKFEGTTLKPNPNGKCKECLKDITKADRCFDGGFKGCPIKLPDIVSTTPARPTTMAPTTAAPPTPAPPTPPPTPAPAPPPTPPPPAPPPSQDLIVTEAPLEVVTSAPTTTAMIKPTRPPSTLPPVTTTTEDPRSGWCPRKCGEVDCRYRITNALNPYKCIHCTESVCKNAPKWSLTIAYDEEACTKCKYCIRKMSKWKQDKCAQYWN